MAEPRTRLDAVGIELWKSRFSSVAAEMGVTLRRSSYSANIKERHDCSTAIFDATGGMIAQGDDIPVHLGSMPMSVVAALRETRLHPGDIVILNDPFMGGTHLPDLTMVSGVFPQGHAKALFHVANRAHHADIGGMQPGSMPLANEIFQEGLRIPPVKLVRGGHIDADLLRLLLANVRTPDERHGDLRAQIAANTVGTRRLLEMIQEHGAARVVRSAVALQDYAEDVMRAFLKTIPAGHYAAVDHLDDDGRHDTPIRIAVQIGVGRGRARVDFRGTHSQVEGGMNAIEAITRSAVFYVFRALVPEAIPSNDGCMRPLEVIVPRGSVVAAEAPAAVAGGNVETSQRLVDVLFMALQPALPESVPACSSGTMNNITIGGRDHDGRIYTYYETIGGGMGARPSSNGLSGVHTHMTNSLNTPIEALHHQYPFRVTRYAVRRRSGGKGRYRGGDGLIREFAFQLPAHVTVLSERRRIAPPGLAGGGPGKVGRNRLWRDGRWRNLPGKFEIRLVAGDRLRIETPGGGGWGER